MNRAKRQLRREVLRRVETTSREFECAEIQRFSNDSGEELNDSQRAERTMLNKVSGDAMDAKMEALVQARNVEMQYKDRLPGFVTVPIWNLRVKMAEFRGKVEASNPANVSKER